MKSERGRQRVTLIALTIALGVVALIVIFRSLIVETLLTARLRAFGIEDSKIQLLTLGGRSAELNFSGLVNRPDFKATINFRRLSVSYTLRELLRGELDEIIIEEGEAHIDYLPKGPEGEETSKEWLRYLQHRLPLKTLETKGFKVNFKREGNEETKALLNLNYSREGVSIESHTVEGDPVLNIKGVIAPGNLDFSGDVKAEFVTPLSVLLLPSDIQAEKGELSFTVKLSYPETATATIKLKKASGVIYGTKVSDVDIALAFSDLSDFELSSGLVTMGRAEHFLTVTNFKGGFSIERDSSAKLELNLKDLSAELFNGKALLKRAVIPFYSPNWRFEIALSEIDLKEVLSLYPQTKVSVTGRVNATLPIEHTKSGFFMNNGEAISSTAGTIEVLELNLPNMAKEVAELLRHFIYEKLRAEIAYEAEGDLNIKLALSGKNPNWQGGRAVDLNINLSENLPALIKTTRLLKGGGVVKIPERR